MNCIILAKGEKSRRLGVEKPFLVIDGKSIIDIVFDRIKGMFEMIYIVSTIPEKFYKFENVNVKILKDEIKCGPLGGIYTGLINSSTYYNFVLGVDLIFVNKEMIRYMMESVKGYDVFVPKTKAYIQPLCAIYSKRATEFIKKKIQEGNFKVKDIFSNLDVKFLMEEELKKFGNPEILFFNLNTENDIKKAEYLWEKFF